jgi:HAD superfamily hydrolase (TIGR01509 family)
MTLLIYDCDGVLVDSEPLANAVLADLLTALGHPIGADEAMRIFGGRSVPDVLRRAEAMLGRPIPDGLGEAAAARLLDRLRTELKPIAGVAAVVGSLSYRRCVASSSPPERIALSLEVTGLAPLFGPHVYSAAQVAKGKPAPDLFLFAAARMGEIPARSIVIEDTTLGVTAARAAGMAAIGFAGGSHAVEHLADRLKTAGADTVVGAMTELPTAIEHLVRRFPPP